MDQWIDRYGMERWNDGESVWQKLEEQLSLAKDEERFLLMVLNPLPSSNNLLIPSQSRRFSQNPCSNAFSLAFPVGSSQVDAECHDFFLEYAFDRHAHWVTSVQEAVYPVAKEVEEAFDNEDKAKIMCVLRRCVPFAPPSRRVA
eukprot:565982-Rhodomonas_salina.2